LLVVAGLVGGCSSDDDDTNAETPDSGVVAHADSGTGTAADASPPADAGTLPNIPATAVAAGSFKTLVAALQATGLDKTLAGTGPFTVFAPPDTAFAKLPSFLTTELTSAPYKTELTLILGYHVLAGETKAVDLLGKTSTPTTVEGAKLSIDGSNDKVVINGTVNVTTPDVLASNGVIHILDGVLLPTIVDTAVGYDDGTNKFSTLVSAVTTAGLAGTLSGAGTFTVFAPTDAAFAALPPATLSAVLADKARLTRLLTYHVLPATVFSPSISNGQVATVEGTDELTLTVSGGKVTVGDSTSTAANVILADLPTSNGVVHAIDKVLLPPNL
jgi:uncharacterized surface protein with fasciclin (FAS1) repeats